MVEVCQNTVPDKDVCVRSYAVDTRDVPAVIQVVIEEKCDDFFVGETSFFCSTVNHDLHFQCTLRYLRFL